MESVLKLIQKLYALATRGFNSLQSPLLLAIRLYWGWQFAQDGWGKLTHLSRVAGFFTSLNLPHPTTTALLVALIELIGGILLACGVAARITSLILFVTMTVAYLAVPDDRINFSHILSNPSDFYNATPYTYWFAALLILIFGAGWFSADKMFDKFIAQRLAGSNSRRAALSSN